MNSSELKAKLLAAIKPKSHFWRDSLMIDMLDYEYPIHSATEIAVALSEA
jgi:hypothetical protein